MRGKKLTNQEIQAQLQEGRNYKRLYLELKDKYDRVTGELNTENQELRQMLSRTLEQNKTQAIQIAELQQMVFGKKKRPPMGGAPSDSDQQTNLSAAPKQPRSKDSYRRPIPPASAVTQEVTLPLPDRCTCGGRFDPGSLTTHERYQEDIPLPKLTPGYQARLVTRYQIERGVCLACGRRTVGANRDLGGAQVALGSNVRLLVCHLISVAGMSYSQVAGLFLGLYGLTITDGEVASILQKQHQAWLPAYEQLQADIRAAPVVHGDETPWPIQDLQAAGYAWNISDAATPKVCFALEQSRGAVHAQTLFGQNTNQPFAGVRITDDYAAYRNLDLPGRQQLCWAHLYRTIRDLRHNANLSEEQLPHVRQWYESFAAIYQDLRQYLDEPYDEVVRKTQSTELWERTQQLAHGPAPRAGEPQKLTHLKAQLTRAGQDRLFVCLVKNTPCDNNRAERDLRQLVLKRKRSFGSKTERGAQALATILSLCTTAWRTTPQDYFKTLASLAG
jgi:transposase